MNAQDLSCNILEINFSSSIQKNVNQEGSKKLLGK